MIGDHDDAEDVTQQVCMTLHRKLGDFESRARFTTWLYAIVRNASTELSRKASRRHEHYKLIGETRIQAREDGVFRHGTSESRRPGQPWSGRSRIRGKGPPSRKEIHKFLTAYANHHSDLIIPAIV